MHIMKLSSAIVEQKDSIYQISPMDNIHYEGIEQQWKHHF